MTTQPNQSAKNAHGMQLGLDNPCFDSNKIFRATLDAISRPGSVHACDVQVPVPSGFNNMACCLALTLCDADTPVWLAPDCNSSASTEHLAFHTGMAFVDHPGRARWVFCTANSDLHFLENLSIGTEEYPDRACSLVLMVDDHSGGLSTTLSGPGIVDQQAFSPRPLDRNFWNWAVDNHALYPQGVDTFFASEHAIAALPRSTRIEL